MNAKKLIALLLAVCLVAGLFVGCKKKPQKPATDPTATVATDATDATEAPDATDAPDATEGTGATEEVENPDATEAPEETDASGNKRPTAATRPKTSKTTEATKATTAATKATQAVATKATVGANVNVNSPYKGKTLEIYGWGTNDSEHYLDIQKMIDLESTEIYPYIERAAIVEWAEMNGVTLDFKGDYNQNTVMSAISAGDTPDVIAHHNQFNSMALNGLAAPLTNAEYKKLGEVVGTQFLDLARFAGKNLGFCRPWTGTWLLYYNVDMFNDYGVKTPKEYFLEGNWNWETFQEVMVAMTKDTDGDGNMDTYGLADVSFAGSLVSDTVKFNDKGEMISVINEPHIQDYIAMKYDCFNNKKCVAKGTLNIQKNVVSPMFAMQISDCEPYNWQHLYQDIPNGQRLEVAPIPVWVGKNGETNGKSDLTQSFIHMAASCDEREAVIDMLIYMVKCTKKYVSDYSLGTVACEYEGLQGTSEYSKKVLDGLKKINASRAKQLKALGDIYDAEYVTKLNEYLDKRGYDAISSFGVTTPIGYNEITQMEPASSIPAIKGKYENAIAAFNRTYIN